MEKCECGGIYFFTTPIQRNDLHVLSATLCVCLRCGKRRIWNKESHKFMSVEELEREMYPAKDLDDAIQKR